MRRSLPRRSMAVAPLVLVATLVFVLACSSSGQETTTPSASTVPGTGNTVALGTNNPAQGDCTTNTSDAAASVGSVALSFTWASLGGVRCLE